jgi:hypothetical protein
MVRRLWKPLRTTLPIKTNTSTIPDRTSSETKPGTINLFCCYLMKGLSHDVTTLGLHCFDKARAEKLVHTKAEPRQFIEGSNGRTGSLTHGRTIGVVGMLREANHFFVVPFPSTAQRIIWRIVVPGRGRFEIQVGA